MIVTTKELFQEAYGNYAIGAYNINNLEQTVGLFRGNLGKVERMRSRSIRRSAPRSSSRSRAVPAATATSDSWRP